MNTDIYVYEPVAYKVSETRLKQFCAPVLNYDCTINAFQVLQQLNPNTCDIMREILTARGGVGLHLDTCICILNIVGGHGHNVDPPMYRFGSYEKDQFLRIITHIHDLEALIVYIGRTTGTSHLTVFARDTNSVIWGIDPQLQPKPTTGRHVTIQTMITLDDYMANEPDARWFAIVEKCTGTKKQIGDDTVKDFMKFTDEQKLQILKNESSRLNAVTCWTYAAKLDKYISNVKENYIYAPFTDVFNEKDVDEMLMVLNQCKDKTYNWTVVPWLTKARKALVDLNDFIKLPDNQKLSQLKRELNTLIHPSCVRYAKMLHIYIQNVGTNYAPFISTFNEGDIQTMDANLPQDTCPGNTYNSDILPWLEQAYKRLQFLNEFIKADDHGKLSRLKASFVEVKDPNDCGIYAFMLDNYIQKVGANYTSFIYKFTDKNIQNMKRDLKSDKCPHNIYNSIIPWLDEARKHIQKKNLKVSDNRNLSWLKTNLNKIDPTNCKHYAHMLHNYIQKVGLNYVQFMQIMNVIETQTIIRKLRACHKSEFNNQINWLTNAINYKKNNLNT